MVPSAKTIAMLLVASLGALGLVFLRMVTSGTGTYYYMVVNLFLAWIPILLSSFLLFSVKRPIKKHLLRLLPLFFLWLLFLPNAPYMVTDFIHLKLRDSTPLWFDILLLHSFALLGLGLAVVSLFQIENLLIRLFGKKKARMGIIVLLFLTSAGVSVGRFYRWNSWEVFTSPSELFSQFAYTAFVPQNMWQPIAFTIFFFFFFLGVYLMILEIRKGK